MENKNVIQKLKDQIEERKEVVTRFKSQYINQDKIVIDKKSLENLLNEFELTISHSLQVIRIYEYKFFDNEIRSERLNKESGSIQTSNIIKEENKQNTYEARNNIKTPTRKETNLTNVIDESKEIKFDQYKFENNFDAIDETMKEERQNTESNPFKDNFIYHRNINLHNIKRIGNTPKNVNSEIINIDTPNFNTEMTHSNQSEDFTNIKLNYDYSNLKDFKNLVGGYSNSTDINVSYLETIPEILSHNETKDKKNNPQSVNTSNNVVKVQNFQNSRFIFNEPQPESLATIHSIFNLQSNTIESHDKSAQNTIEVPKGMRQKILNKKHSGKNNITDPSSMINYKTIDNDIATSADNFKIEKKKAYTKGNLLLIIAIDIKVNRSTDSETHIPQIISKQSSFTNRLSELEKVEREIITENIIKKLKNNEAARYFLSLKYGNGVYEEFLKKLNNYQLDLSEIELDIKSVKDSIIDENNNKDNTKISSHSSTSKERQNNRVNSNRNNQSKNYNTTSSVNKSFSSVKSNDSSSRARTNSKKRRESKSSDKNEYIAPVKFENFLRSNNKSAIKNKNNI
jgi:hypothetical protein